MPRLRRVSVLSLVAFFVFARVGFARAANGGDGSADRSAVSRSEGNAKESLAAARRLEFTDSAQGYAVAEKAIAMARLQRDTATELGALLLAGKTARYLNRYANARAMAEAGLALASETKSESFKGEFHLLLGYVNWNQADLPAACAHLFAAERIGRAEKNLSLQIGVESVRGLVEARSDNPQASLLHLEAARALAEKSGDAQLPSVLNNLGSHYLSQKDYARARECYERALPMARDGDNQRLITFLLVNLGQLGVETGDGESAKKYLAEALSLSEHYGIRRGAADAYYQLASLERRLGDFEQSVTHLDQSLAIAQQLKNPDLFALIYAEYVAIDEARGNYREALDYTQKLTAQTEIIRGEKNRRLVALLTAQYDADSRAKQIKLLQRDRDLDQTALALKDTEISRARTRYSALALALVLGTLAVSAFASRQRARTRLSNLALARTRAAKEEVEVADANKARLLTIAAQNLQESEARFRSAFELSPLGMALVGIDGKWLRVNPALCRTLGFEESELLATDFQSITHPDDLSTDLEYVADLLDGTIETYQMEKRYFHKDGHVLWVCLDVSLIRDPETHQPRSFISQVQDISARRRAEEQLHHAKEEAERANAAKSEFLSRMSHELRTPLNAILGFGQLLEIQDLGVQPNQSVVQILTASRHLLELINEVLDISTIESGCLALSLEPTSADDIIRGVYDLVAPLADQAGVRLLPFQRDGNGCMLADPRRLRQVLLNLLSNAIKYNRAGGEVSLACRFSGGRVRIEVKDTGFGIAADDLDKIFVPFQRLPAAFPVAGTGLGLSLSKALTEAMNGTLSVASEAGTGSTFTVEFPVMADDAEWSAPEFSFDPVAASLFEPEELPTSTLLYVEDNAINVELLQLMFCRNGQVRVLAAQDGKTGLKMAAEHAPDLILLDVHLPDMAGSEVLRRLRADPALREVPVIVISADVSAAQIQRMEALGVAEYIKKPFDLKDLRRAINAALHEGVLP